MSLIPKALPSVLDRILETLSAKAQGHNWKMLRARYRKGRTAISRPPQSSGRHAKATRR